MLAKLRESTLFGQLAKFGITGVFTALIDWSLTMGLQAFGVNRQLAKAGGWAAGTTVAYLVNAKWTFQVAVTRSSAIAVALLYLSTFAVQNLIYWAVDSPLQSLGLEGMLKDTVAFVIAQGVATITNFIFQRVVIFRG